MKKLLVLSVLVLGFAFAGSALAVENWFLSGNYNLTFSCTSGCTGDYPHTMTVSVYDNVDGTFSGTGFRNAVPSQTWTVTGDITGDVIEFYIYYDGSPYYVDAEGTIATDGSMAGTAFSATQIFDWTLSPNATLNRHAEIVKPEENEIIFGNLDLEAYLFDNDEDYIDWAVRRGTCAAGTDTVLGNVDGHHDSLTMTQDGYTYTYTGSFVITGYDGGIYCFIFNPREDAGEDDIRLTREFYIAERGISGGGQIIEKMGGKPKDNLKISFGGYAWDLGSAGYVGDWQINFHNVNRGIDDGSKFHTTEITTGSLTTMEGSLGLYGHFNAEGTFNGETGYSVRINVIDAGEPNNDDDIRIRLYQGTELIYDSAWDFTPHTADRTLLDNGNLQVFHQD